jgi:hypothetical protein
MFIFNMMHSIGMFKSVKDSLPSSVCFNIQYYREKYQQFLSSVVFSQKCATVSIFANFERFFEGYKNRASAQEVQRRVDVLPQGDCLQPLPHPHPPPHHRRPQHQDLPHHRDQDRGEEPALPRPHQEGDGG